MHELRNRLWRSAKVLLAAGVTLAVVAQAAAHEPGPTSRPTSEPTQITVFDARPAAGIAAAPSALMASPYATQGIAMDPAPGSALATSGSESVHVISNIYYTQPVNCGASTCQVALDIYVPAGPGPYPTVVLIRGGPSGIGGRVGLGGFATQLASNGLIVYNADYRDLASSGGGYPEAFQDVACAIRYARATAPNFGGNGVVTLVGHSFGGFVGSVVALDPTEFTGGCLEPGSGRPDAFVGLAGNYDLSYNESDLAKFFGAGPSQTSTARASSDPFKYATGLPIPVRLIAGTSDESVDPEDSVELNAFLAAKGWDVSLNMVSHGTHMSILDGSAGGAVLQSIQSAQVAQAAQAAGSNDPVLPGIEH